MRNIGGRVVIVSRVGVDKVEYFGLRLQCDEKTLGRGDAAAKTCQL
jgi:hypothetical protein